MGAGGCGNCGRGCGTVQREGERERERERERKIILAIMVQSLCVVVGKLTDRVDQVFCQSAPRPIISQQQPSSSVPVSGSAGDDIRITTIREEIVELEERRKRRDSLIFRGIYVSLLTLMKLLSL